MIKIYRFQGNWIIHIPLYREYGSPEVIWFTTSHHWFGSKV